MDRRHFLGTISAATLLSRRLSFAADNHRIEKIGVQLYTVRSEIKNNFEGTIAKVAQIAYKEVEFAGYFDHSPKDIRAILDRNGLTGPSTHAEYKVLAPDQWPQALEAGKIIGHEYIVNPWVPEELRKTPDDWKRVADNFNRAGSESKKAGIQFAYHNHWFEFQPLADGQLPYDILLKNCDANLVKMELDLCWITVAGKDPLQYFSSYPGRFPLVHVKDTKGIPKADATGAQDFGSSMKEMTEVGSGIIDWKRIFAKSGEAGIKHSFVEHDNPSSPFESITKSYQYLQQLRF
jgi:sugar phosphate isomerase/epimerase